MDTPVERKPGINRKHLYTIGGVALGIAVILYFIFRDTASSMTVEKDRLTIATVKQAEFNDYIRVIGQVMPSRIIYMDAIEGGRVEERLKEEGAMVKAGDVILRLSNPLLNIGIMQSEADLAYQENELRNTRISMEQERLQLKQERIGLNKELTLKKRRYEQYRRLVEEQLIAREDFRQAEEEYEAAKEQLAVIDERIRQDNIFRESQISSLDENIRNMKRSLTLVRERLENLKIKAPIDGQVGNLNAQVGQSISAGEHIGQIITPDLKVQAQAYQVTNAYYKLILERKLLNLALEQSRLSERYLKQTEAFVELGLKSASDLQEVKARREGDIYRYKSRENTCRLALLHLEQLMNFQPGDTLVIQDTIVEANQLPLLSVPSTETLYAQSLEILPVMRMIDLKRKAARKEYAMAGGTFSPSVYARFTVGSNFYNTVFSARQLRDNIGKYVGIGISFPLLSGLERLTHQRKQKLNLYRLKNEEELEKQQLYTDIEQTLLSLHAGFSEHQQVLQQLEAEALVLKESERKWEEGLISVFQLMEARNRFISAKAELVRVRLQVEMMRKLEKYYREGTFL